MALWTTYGVGYPYSIGSLAGQGALTGQLGAGNRENLMDPIVILDPTDTPFLNMIPKEDINAPYVEWLVDQLATTSTAVAAEGADFTTSGTVTPTARLRYQNVTQVQRTDFIVSRSQIQTSQRGMTAGIRNEYQFQLFKKLKELLRNVDASAVGNTASVTAVTGTTAVSRVAAKLRNWETSAVSSGVVKIDNGTAVFATSKFASLHQTMDGQGADPDTMFVSSGVKADISNLILNNNAAVFNATGQGNLRRFNQEASDKEWDAIIDVITDDFGRVMIVRDRWMPSATSSASTWTASSVNSPAYFLVDRSKLKFSFFQRPDHFPLPPNGDAQRGFVLTEWTFKVLHPSAVGICYNLLNN